VAGGRLSTTSFILSTDKMMINTTEHSRLDLVRELCILFFIEAIVATAFKAFPFAELIVAQGSVVGGYLAAKTVSNVNQAKYEKRNPVGD
jgi:hypothetical protein